MKLKRILHLEEIHQAELSELAREGYGYDAPCSSPEFLKSPTAKMGQSIKKAGQSVS